MFHILRSLLARCALFHTLTQSSLVTSIHTRQQCQRVYSSLETICAHSICSYVAYAFERLYACVCVCVAAHALPLTYTAAPRPLLYPLAYDVRVYACVWERAWCSLFACGVVKLFRARNGQFQLSICNQTGQTDYNKTIQQSHLEYFLQFQYFSCSDERILIVTA